MAVKQGCNSDGELFQDRYVEHEPVYAMHEDDGRTRQEFAAECDINVILARYEKVGVINHFNAGVPQYLDLTEMPSDLQSALLYVEMARESFMTLPATVRREFENDPVLFAEFAADPKNVDRMREWGLAAPRAVADAVTPAPGGEPEAPPSAAPATA